VTATGVGLSTFDNKVAGINRPASLNGRLFTVHWTGLDGGMDLNRNGLPLHHRQDSRQQPISFRQVY
jgi:hypothetical protein